MPASPTDPISHYRGHRFPPEVIVHAVWLDFRFHLSFRDVRDLLAERDIVVSHEVIRQWCTKFAATYAAGLRGRRARPGDEWYLDEVWLKIRGKRHWLWRAVDQDGVVLDILVQERCDQHAAERFLRRVLGSCAYEPRVVVTEKLTSSVPAIRRVLPHTEHRRHKRLNNRAENSHCRPASGSGSCSASNPPSTPSVSSARSAPSATTSAHADTASPRPPADRSVPNDTPSGWT